MARIFNKDTVSGIFFAGFALILLFVLIPLQVDPSEGGPVALSPRLFCHVIGVLLLLLSLALCISSYRKSAQENNPAAEAFIDTDALKRGLVTVVFSVLYVSVMSWLGYFFSSVLTMLFFLWFFGARKWQGVLVFLIVILPFIYVLFVLALKVMLPSGIIM